MTRPDGQDENNFNLANYLSVAVHRLVIVQELAADLTALEHLRQPFDFLQRARLRNGFADLLDVGGVGCYLWFVLVRVGDVQASLLLDLLLQFLSFLALEERCRFESLVLLDFLEVQETKMWQTTRWRYLSLCWS